MDTLTIVLIAVAVAAVAFGVYMYMQRERTARLKKKYGPEYERLAAESGRTSVDSRLVEREERVKKYHIRSLEQGERQSFASAWLDTQARFVDDPRMAISNADDLVCRVMERRGYPMADFDRRAEDVSVDHPHVVEHYRAAHDIAMRDRRHPVDTEDLRRAMIHYRALFEDLLGTNVTNREEVHR